MRILILTNFYPPHHIGGYELGCRDVADALRRRGHAVEVLTSTYGVRAPSSELGVHRRLRTEWPAPSRWKILRQERTNQRAMRAAIRSFRPDVVYVWNLSQISISILAIAEQMGLPIAYYISDEWLVNWAEREHRWSAFWAREPQTRSGRAGKRIGRVFVTRVLGLCTGERHPGRTHALRYQNVQFASQFLRDATARAVLADQTTWEVIRWGIDTEVFAPSTSPATRARRLLYVGQVVPHKGVHTAVEAVRVVREEFGYSDIALDIVGPSTANVYVDDVQALIASHHLEQSVHLFGAIDRRRLPQIYRDHDMLVFPSEWQEPFSITLLEALSSQMPVVSTLTGGSDEILRVDVNALVFKAGDARDCATQIVRLLTDVALASRIAEAGRRTVAERYTLSGMVDRLEAGLRQALGTAQLRRAHTPST